MLYRYIYILSFFAISIHSLAQSCSFKISDRIDFYKNNYPETELFFKLQFVINGVKVTTNDTNTINIPINLLGFDSIFYSYKNNKDQIITESALCKLKAKETYSISPCTCCGIFLITPSKNAKRGFVQFINKSNNEYIAIPSEFDHDTLSEKSNTGFIYSSISMNCGFRPNRIFIANQQYFDKKYQYDNWSTKSVEIKKELEIEQETHVVYSFNYLFLHEEKLTVTIDNSGTAFKIDLN